MVNPRILTDNVLRSRQEHRDSEEEISYGEIVSDLLADITPGRGCVITNTFITCGFLLFICLFWRYYGGNILTREPLGCEDIQVLYQLESGESSRTPPFPLDVSRRDLVGEVWTEATADGKMLLLLDTELNESLHMAMRKNVWIANVLSIQKLYPPRVRIVLECRQPALIVCVPDAEATPGGDGMVDATSFPVARDGTVLPEKDFAGQPLVQYPWLVDINSVPSDCRPGFHWNDERVTEALGIASAFGDMWRTFGLRYIRVKDKHTTGFKNGMPFGLDVETGNGSVIRWKGSDEAAHEKVPDSEKVAVLREHFERNGELDAPGKRRLFSFEIHVGDPEP